MLAVDNRDAIGMRNHECVVFLASWLLAHGSVAQTLSAPRPIYTEVPVGGDIVQQDSRSRIPGEVTHTLVRSLGINDLMYSIVATKGSDGSLLWRADDVGIACSASSANGARIKELPSGDLVFTIDIYIAGTHPRSTTCLIKLSGSDGQVQWIYDGPELGNSSGLNAFGVAANGDLLLAGFVGDYPSVLRLEGQTGILLWRHDFASSVDAGTGIAVTDEINGRAVVAIAGGNRSTVINFSTANGVELWRRQSCSVLEWSVAQKSQLQLNHDGSLLEFSECGIGVEAHAFSRKLNVDGDVVWRRDLAVPLDTGSPLSTVDIGTDYVLVRGRFIDNGQDVGFVALGAESGEILWTKQASDTMLRPLIAGSDEIHMLERDAQFGAALQSLDLITLSALDGKVLGTLPLPLDEGSTSVANIDLGALANGDVVLKTLNCSDPSWWGGCETLRVSRIQPRVAVRWTQEAPFVGDRPFLTFTREISSRMVLAGTPMDSGILVAGWTPSFRDEYDHPRVRKIDASSGLDSWIWVPAGDADFIAAIARNEEGDAFALVSVSQGAQGEAQVARLDGSTGTTVWSSGLAGFPALDIAATADRVYALGSSNGGALGVIAAFAQADGALLWRIELPLPDAYGTELEVLANGDVALISGTMGHRELLIAKVRASDGTELWRTILVPVITVLGASVVLAPANGDAVFTHQNAVWRVDGTSGDVLWRQSLPFQILDAKLDSQGHIVVAGKPPNSLEITAIASLDPVTGLLLWSSELDAEPLGASALNLSANGNILVAGSAPARMWVAELARSTGAVLWHSSALAESSATPPLFVRVLWQPGLNVVSPLKNGDAVIGGGWYPTSTWTSFRVSGINANAIFANGFDP